MRYLRELEDIGLFADYIALKKINLIQWCSNSLIRKMDFYNSRYFNINKNMLIFMGIWPYENKFKKFLKRGIFMVVVSISLVPQLLSLHKYKAISLDKMLQGIATVLYIITIAVKMLTFVIFEDKITLVYENIIQNWKLLDNNKEKSVLIKYSENGRLLTIGYMSYMFSALLIFITIPSLPIIIDCILPINGSRPKIFILDGEFIINKYEYYEYVYIFEACTCLATVLVFTAIDSTYAVCVEQCIGLMAAVKLRLKMSTSRIKYIKSSDDNQEDTPYVAIVETVELHKKALNFANVLESSFSTNFLIIMGANALIISVGSTVVIMHVDKPMEFIRYSLIFIGLSIHMFYVSYPGQKVIDRSGSIFYAAYNIEWYNYSIRAQKLLRFLMLRSKEPCELTAGGIYTMNFQNFGSLAKTTLSYMTVFASFR